MKEKTNKGITLIALILTIIVLLILAVVAINAVKGDGIIAHAKNAKTDYTKAQANEQKILLDYEAMLDPWKQEKTKVTKGDTTLNVGDTITNFTAGGYTWQVLGAENGKLLLTTTKKVNDSFTLSGSTAGWSETEKRFVDAEKALDDECKSKITLTEEEKKQVSELRSIKVEDINRVTGYDPKTSENGKPYAAGSLVQYGNEITYSMNASGKVVYSSTTKSSEVTSQTQFWAPNTSANVTSPYTVIITAYGYSYKDSGSEQDSKAFELLFGSGVWDYWLASSCVTIDDYEKCAYFGLRCMSEGSVSSACLWSSDHGDQYNYVGVRPVVSLASDFQPEK